MGLVDVVLTSLCFNCSIIQEGVNDIAQEKKTQLNYLAKELKGKHFYITTVQNKPLSYAEHVNGTLVGKGIAFEFINVLQEKYEFNYTVVLPKEDSQSGNYSGIFGMLELSKADIGAAFLSVMPSYWEYVRYSRSLDIGQWVVLMRRPKESATGSGLLAPFTLQVWMLVLVSLVAVGPIIYAMILLRAKLCEDDESKVFPLPSCIWFVYGALLKQGSVLSPTTDSSRLLFSTWWIFITILTAFYTANLTAFLTLSKFTLQIQTVSDIGAKKYSWVSHKDSAIEEAISHEQEMAASFKGSNGKLVYESSQEIFNKYVKNQNFMYIGEKPIVEHLMYNDYMSITDPNIPESEKCGFVITTWAVLSRPRAFAYSKSFPFYELFDSILQHLVESGIVKYKLQEGLPNTQICPLDLGNKEKQLQNSDLIMTYLIVGIGFAISAVIFIGEFGYNWFSNKKANAPGNFQGDRRPDKLFDKSQTRFGFDNRKGKQKNEEYWDEDQIPTFPPPPPYHALFRPPFAHSPSGEKQVINGREYWLIRSFTGDTRLVPVRAPSAILYQYTN